MSSSSRRIAINHLDSGGLITNYYCTYRCRHCLYGCSPGGKRNTLEKNVLKVKGLGCNSIHIGGGEPFLSLDSEGRIDAGEQEKARRMAVDLFPPVLPEEEPGQVIDAQHRFAKKRYDNEYRWTPSPELEAAIVRAIFGKNGFF
jgi:hypothetical protein